MKGLDSINPIIKVAQTGKHVTKVKEKRSLQTCRTAKCESTPLYLVRYSTSPPPPPSPLITATTHLIARLESLQPSHNIEIDQEKTQNHTISNHDPFRFTTHPPCKSQL